MPGHGPPAIDLATVLFGPATSQVVTTIPLEPAARIVGMNPSFLDPDCHRLAGGNLIIIQLRPGLSVGGQTGFYKPAGRQFFGSVPEVNAAEYAQLQHFGRSQLRLEIGCEMPARWLAEPVAITLLPTIIDENRFLQLLYRLKGTGKDLPGQQ